MARPLAAPYLRPASTESQWRVPNAKKDHEERSSDHRGDRLQDRHAHLAHHQRRSGRLVRYVARCRAGGAWRPTRSLWPRCSIPHHQAEGRHRDPKPERNNTAMTTFVSIAFAIFAMVMAIMAATMNGDQFAMIVSLVLAMIFLATSVLAASATRR